MAPMGETEEQQRLRFQIELEFVQCLANPNYLNFLAQRGYCKDQTFINYVKYLQYWKEPEYARYLKYPTCLHFLDLLQHEAFRNEVANGQCAKFIDDQQLLHWQHYSRRRMQLLSTAQEKETPEQSGSSVRETVGPNNGGNATPSHSVVSINSSKGNMTPPTNNQK